MVREALLLNETRIYSDPLPLSGNNCLALRKAVSAQLPEGTYPHSPSGPEGQLGVGITHPTFRGDLPPHNNGLLVTIYRDWLWSPHYLHQNPGHILAVANS